MHILIGKSIINTDRTQRHAHHLQNELYFQHEKQTLRELGYEDGRWMELAKDHIQWLPLLRTVSNFLGSIMRELVSWLLLGNEMLMRKRNINPLRQTKTIRKIRVFVINDAFNMETAWDYTTNIAMSCQQCCFPHCLIIRNTI